MAQGGDVSLTAMVHTSAGLVTICGGAQIPQLGKTLPGEKFHLHSIGGGAY